MLSWVSWETCLKNSLILTPEFWLSSSPDDCSLSRFEVDVQAADVNIKHIYLRIRKHNDTKAAKSQIRVQKSPRYFIMTKTRKNIILRLFIVTILLLAVLLVYI